MGGLFPDEGINEDLHYLHYCFTVKEDGHAINNTNLGIEVDGELR